MKPLLTLIGIFLIPMISLAQDADPKPLTWKEKYFFHSIGGTILTEFIRPPATAYMVLNYYSTPDSIQTYHSYRSINLFSFTYEPRINLVNIRDYASVSVATPVELALGTYEPSGGGFTLVLPAFVDFNLGDHSTYNNINSLGLHAGVGYQGLVAPLIKLYDKEKYFPRFWGTTVFRFGIKGTIKERNYFMTTTWNIPGKIDDKYQNRVLKEKLYFKIAFGIILNYD